MPRGQPIEERFWSKVDKSAGDEGCWLWTAGKDTSGYGQFNIGVHSRSMLAHRWLMQQIAGKKLQRSEHVLHSCDVVACVNPAHLRIGTHSDNMRDKAMRGRVVSPNKYKTHCKWGHEFTEENTWRNKKGQRWCRACTKRRRLESRARKAETA